jgi:hypothetical protein
MEPHVARVALTLNGGMRLTTVEPIEVLAAHVRWSANLPERTGQGGTVC